MAETVRGIPGFLGGMPRFLGGMPSRIHAGFDGDSKVLEAFSEGLEVVPSVSMLCTWCARAGIGPRVEWDLHRLGILEIAES